MRYSLSLRPATYLYNSWYKGQESIKQKPGCTQDSCIRYWKIILDIMSTEEQMDGITHIRTIQCHAHFQSRMVHKIAFKYFNVIFGAMWHTLNYSIREIPLIWCLNRLIQIINIFVISVTIYNADCSPCGIDKGIHGKHKNSAYHGKYIKSCLDWLVFHNVCLNQSCFPFSFIYFFFPTVDVVFGRWVVHTSVSSLNSSQPKVVHFS